MTERVPVIHAVTDDGILSRPDFLTRATAVMEALGARGAVHVRGPRLPAARLHALALALVPAQERTGAWVVVNDRVDVALAARARAAQLTTRSLLVADARTVAPGLALGASVHSGGDAVAAAAADWLVAGHVYASASHPRQAPHGLELIRAVGLVSALPCIAIGGVRPEHLAALRGAGAHGVAAISGIWGAVDAGHAAIEYLSAYERSDGS